MTADSIVGDGLAQSPYEELRKECARLRAERDTLLTAAVIDTATILRRDEELQMLRAERDEARLLCDEALDELRKLHKETFQSALGHRENYEAEAMERKQLRAERDEAQRIAAQLRTETGERIYRLEKALVEALKERNEAQKQVAELTAERDSETLGTLGIVISTLRAERDEARADSTALAERCDNLAADAETELKAAYAERDALQRKYDCFVGSECAGTIVKGEGYVPACRTLRAERDEARADARRYRWLREHLPQGTLNDCDVDDASSWDAAIDAALKGDAP